jgi:hypothetical protein
MIGPALMGLVLSAFSWSYAFAQLPGGAILDRFGTRLTYAASLVLWSIFTALQGFAKTLRDNDATREQQALALRFAVHIIADLQQPLHAGNGTDKGGNTVRVRWFGRDTELHAVWDSELPNNKGLSYSEYTLWLTRKLKPEEARAWSSADPLVWIAESAALRDRIYPADSRLSYQYVYDHTAEVDLRLTQGGLRIAAWLNSVFARR